MATETSALERLVTDLSELHRRTNTWLTQNNPTVSRGRGHIVCASCHRTVLDAEHHPSCSAPLVEALLVFVRTWRGPANDLAETNLKNVRDVLHDLWPDRVPKRPGYGDQREEAP